MHSSTTSRAAAVRPGFRSRPGHNPPGVGPPTVGGGCHSRGRGGHEKKTCQKRPVKKKTRQKRPVKKKTSKKGPAQKKHPSKKKDPPKKRPVQKKTPVRGKKKTHRKPKKLILKRSFRTSSSLLKNTGFGAKALRVFGLSAPSPYGHETPRGRLPFSKKA